MGNDIEGLVFDDAAFARRVDAALRSLEAELSDPRFDPTGRRRFGLEVENILVRDRAMTPKPLGDRFIERIEAVPGASWKPEVSRFVPEWNSPVEAVSPEGFDRMHRHLLGMRATGEAVAREMRAHLVQIGILPTIAARHLTQRSITPNNRYLGLEQQIVRLRGGAAELSIDGIEESLTEVVDGITFEGACTSMQIHLDLAPAELPEAKNIADVLSALQMATSPNAPVFLGKVLRGDLRNLVCDQTADSRPMTERDTGYSRWALSGGGWSAPTLIEMIETTLRDFPPLLPVVDEDIDVIALAMGTVWPQNRPVADAAHDNVRLENRTLSAPPSVPDGMADTAWWIGYVRDHLAHGGRITEEHFPSALAAENLHRASWGINAELHWPGQAAPMPAWQILGEHVLPRAQRGLVEHFGFTDAQARAVLAPAHQRAETRRTGADFVVGAVREYERAGHSRTEALRLATSAYVNRQSEGAPVAEWAPATIGRVLTGPRPLLALGVSPQRPAGRQWAAPPQRGLHVQARRY